MNIDHDSSWGERGKNSINIHGLFNKKERSEQWRRKREGSESEI